MYNFVELSTVNKDAIKRGKQSEGTATTACSLKSSVAQLVDLMFDEDTIMHSLQEVGLNLDEMPLGAVTAEVVEKARAILERIKQHLESSAKQATRKSAAAQAKAVNAQQVWDQQLQSLTESFYLAIPSVETAAIKTKEALDRKVQLVNMLGDIALTQKALKKQKRASKDKKENKHAALEPHPLDVKYFSLSCSLSKLSKTDPVWTTIDQYFQSSVNASPLAVDPYGMSGFSRRHGTKVKLLEVFDMSREGEADRYASFDALGGRTLLWHGTNVAVAAAICSSGLRIMPNSGGRVGRGIYLANQSVKSGH
jgi:poly [ADP-ribose] polymerase 2/3/4